MRFREIHRAPSGNIDRNLTPKRSHFARIEARLEVFVLLSRLGTQQDWRSEIDSPGVKGNK